MGARILVIDNYDSFVYNLVQYLGELGAAVDVRRNDAIAVEEVAALAPDGIVADSDPESEHRECVNKARATIQAVRLAEAL